MESITFTAAELSHPKYLKLVMFVLADWTRADAEGRLHVAAFPDVRDPPQPRVAVDATTGATIEELPDAEAVASAQVVLSAENPGKALRDATARNALHLTRKEICEALRETAAFMYGRRLAPASESSSFDQSATPPSHLVPGGAAGFAALFTALRAELDAERVVSHAEHAATAALRGADAADASSWESAEAHAIVVEACGALKQKGNALFAARNVVGALCAFADGLALVARFRLLACEDPASVEVVAAGATEAAVADGGSVDSGAADAGSDAGSDAGADEAAPEVDALDDIEARLFFNRASVCMRMASRSAKELAANPTLRAAVLPALSGYDPINDDEATKARRRKVALLRFVERDCDAAIALRRGAYPKACVRRNAAAALAKVESERWRHDGFYAAKGAHAPDKPSEAALANAREIVARVLAAEESGGGGAGGVGGAERMDDALEAQWAAMAQRKAAREGGAAAPPAPPAPAAAPSLAERIAATEAARRDAIAHEDAAIAARQ
jgi:hypothetical protein